MSCGETIISAYQLLVEQLAKQRPVLESLDTEIFFTDNGPQPKSLIEISGPSNSGKSLLMWQLMARCLLPTYFGGKYCDVVLIDLGHMFFPPHFVTLLRSTISESGESYTVEESAQVVHKCLESMTVLNCYSAEQFDLALDEVEDILMKNHNVALIAIDNLDAFYWLDVHKKLLRMSTHYSRQLSRLKELCENHNICCMFTVNSRNLETNLRCANTTVDYRIKLDLQSDGARTINERPISINDKGIRFIK